MRRPNLSDPLFGSDTLVYIAGHKVDASSKPRHVNSVEFVAQRRRQVREAGVAERRISPWISVAGSSTWPSVTERQ
jgi:hypothetical protein